jgi:serine protease Do
MSPRRTLSTLLAIAAGVALLLASGALHVHFDLRGNAARAIDLFGSKEEKKKSEEPAAQGEAFWSEKSDAPEVVPRGVPGSFADLAERVAPGVVNIQTSKTVVSGQQLPRQFEEFFFGAPFGELFRQYEQKVPSLGSGFVISPDGYIVTNNHVIEDVDTIKVAFMDGREVEAEIVGRDPKTDLALIRVKADTELFALPLGDSDAVRPGEWVVAIGNPFGLEHTVTAGIVSAKHRIIGQGSYDDYIQTDAAINPGNSGGPLLNLKGEVVGINTAINPRANTIGFAVPVNMAKDILPQLRTSGSVTRGWLGVVIQRITPELSEHLELESERGALVSRVLPGGPAAEAGIERGDVIVEFNGKPVEDWNDLPRMVAATPVDAKVELVVLREGKRKTLEARVGVLEEPGTEVASQSAEEGQAAEAFGLRVQDLTPEIAEQLGVEDAEGVLVTAVEPGSAAHEAGLRRGDLILEVDRHEVKTVEDVKQQLESAEKSALLLIRRGDTTLFVPVKRSTG